MSPRRFDDIRSPRDDELRRLKDELFLARHAIVSLMPEDLQLILMSFWQCESRQDTYGWMYRAAEGVIARAEALSEISGWCGGDRALCPLCGAESSAPYDRGFSLPEGLRRHLTGQGRTHQCSVFGAAMAMATESWHKEFDEVELAERAAEQARLEKRRKSEVQYRTSPDGLPLLSDEGVWSADRVRTPSRLTWAERRLNELGFETTLDRDVKSYTRLHADVIVYADPRTEGSIHFAVYKKDPARARAARRLSGYLGGFSMQDNWRHDLRDKYERRIARWTGNSGDAAGSARRAP